MLLIKQSKYSHRVYHNLFIATVNSKPAPRRGTIQQELVRFEELHTKFQRNKSMNKPGAILHLLL